MLYIAVGIAGMAGALLRYYLSIAIGADGGASFPAATLIINLIGCFVLSWFTFGVGTLNKLPAWFRVGFSTGLIGSFTTFSTFSVETVQLARQSLWGTAAAYVLLSVWGGLVMAWAGYRAANIPRNRRR